MANYAEQIAPGRAYSASQTQDAPTRPLEVPQSMDRLANLLDTLFSRVEMLDNRLTGYVARPHGPMPAPEAKNQIKGMPSTGLGGQLDTFCERVLLAGEQVSSLIERLEA